MVSPQKYLGVLVKAIGNSQQLWMKLTQDRARLAKSLPQIGPQKEVLDDQLLSLRKNLQGQLIFLDKVKRHIDYFSQWSSRENIENLAFVPIKKYTKLVFSTFNAIQSNVEPLRSLIFIELELLNKTNSSNFAETWPRFLALYDKEKQLLSQIEDLTRMNDGAVKDLIKALKNVATQAQLPLQVRSVIGTVEFGLKVAVAGFAMYLLAPLALPEEAIETFGGLSNMVAGGAAGIGIVDFFRKTIALTAELAKR